MSVQESDAHLLSVHVNKKWLHCEFILKLYS